MSVSDAACRQFLRTVLPQLGLRWSGYRRVCGQVIKRLKRRLRQLQLPDLQAYATYLARHPEEWQALEALCCITISRFYRDPEVFAALETEVFPALARRALRLEQPTLQGWSVGCASGEEAYTLMLLWRLRLAPRYPTLRFCLLATDVDATVLDRARCGQYPAGSLKALPAAWRDQGFERTDGSFVVRPAFRQGIRFAQQDIRREWPAGSFHLILCRNLVFTYFSASWQRAILHQLVARLRPGGVLVIGKRESLPAEAPPLQAVGPVPGIWQKLEPSAPGHRAAG